MTGNIEHAVCHVTGNIEHAVCHVTGNIEHAVCHMTGNIEHAVCHVTGNIEHAVCHVTGNIEHAVCHVTGNIEHAVCHMTGNVCLLVRSNPQTPNMQALSYFTKSCAVCRFKSVFAGICKTKALDRQAINYIPTSWSRDTFLSLETFLNLAFQSQYSGYSL